MEEKESSNSGSQEKTDSGSPTPISGGVGVVVVGSGPPGLGGEGGGGGGASDQMGGILMRGKKRGRPRKYDAEGNFNPAYLAAVARRAAAAQPPMAAAQQPGKVVAPPPGFTLTVAAGGGSGGGGGGGGGESGGSRRGRGKIGNNNNNNNNNNIGAWQQQQQQLQQPLSPLGEIFANTAGGDFTPHVITVQTGEDVAAKILSFSQKGPRGICVLSANGSISNVTIRQPGSSGGLLTYEGRFEILSLTGSYTISESGGVTSRTGGLSISLAGPDGRVVGGGVAGWLTAATPIQVVVGSFVPGGYNNNNKLQKRRYNRESSNTSAIPEAVTGANRTTQLNPGGEGGPPPHMSMMMEQSHSEADDSIGSGHNLNVVSSHDTLDWNNGVSDPSSDHRMYPDINVSVPGV